jgi:RNA polymerase sigma factor (sigma-70 family)
VSDLDVLNRIQSFLATPRLGERASPAELLAWEDFFQAHDLMVRSIVKHGGMSQSDLDDLVQEIWLLLVRRLPKLSLDPARGTLHAWVAAVARHQAGRHARRRSRHHQDVLDPELASALLDLAHNPVTEMERKQQQSLVQAVIAEMGKRMPERQHRIIVEYWINEQSTSAIAEALHMSPECVWSTIRRARPGLLDRLRRAGLDVQDGKIPRKPENLDR